MQTKGKASEKHWNINGKHTGKAKDSIKTTSEKGWEIGNKQKSHNDTKGKAKEKHWKGISKALQKQGKRASIRNV